jgi:hypothetical protein
MAEGEGQVAIPSLPNSVSSTSPRHALTKAVMPAAIAVAAAFSVVCLPSPRSPISKVASAIFGPSRQNPRVPSSCRHSQHWSIVLGKKQGILLQWLKTTVQNEDRDDILWW